MIHFRQIFVLLAVIMALVSCDKPQTQKKDVIVEAIPIVTIAPRYPTDVPIGKREGKVTIAFTVTEFGTVKDPKIISSSPAKIFDRASLRAIVKFKFAPKRINGKAVESNVVQTIKFKLAE